jgi:hypothetical protein
MAKRSASTVKPGKWAFLHRTLKHTQPSADTKEAVSNIVKTESNTDLTNMQERRSEPRIETGASVVLTPLAAVSTRLTASVVNVSMRGVRVHVGGQMKELPRPGEVFRVQSRDDLMLCEVCHAGVAAAGAQVGLKIVYWSAAGELNRLVQGHQLSLA